MTSLQGAVESSAPVSRLHEHRSFELADFPVPTGARGVHSPDSAGEEQHGRWSLHRANSWDRQMPSQLGLL
jgi:hypothetical protein